MKKQTTASYHKKTSNIPIVLSHRGACSIVPENTLEAFSIAISQNANFVEMDVIQTADKKQIVFHDPCLGRVSNAHDFPEFENRQEWRYVDYKFQEIFEIYADKLTLEEIKQLKVLQTIGPNYGGRSKIFDNRFSIPTMEETIELFLQQNKEKKQWQISQNKKVDLTGINLEVKQSQMYRQVFGQDFNHAEEVLKTLKKYGLDDPQFCEANLPIIISSFDVETVKYFKAHTNLPCFQLTNHVYPISLEYLANYSDGVCCDLEYLFDKVTYKPTDYLEKAHALGLQVFGFTIKDDDLQYANNYFAAYDFFQNIVNIDGIFAEFSEKAKAIFEAFEIRSQNLEFKELNSSKDEYTFFPTKKVKKTSALLGAQPNYNVLQPSTNPAKLIST